MFLEVTFAKITASVMLFACCFICHIFLKMKCFLSKWIRAYNIFAARKLKNT